MVIVVLKQLVNVAPGSRTAFTSPAPCVLTSTPVGHIASGITHVLFPGLAVHLQSTCRQNKCSPDTNLVMGLKCCHYCDDDEQCQPVLASYALPWLL